MRISLAHITALVTVLIAAHLAPAIHAVTQCATSCCVPAATEASLEFRGDSDAGCCSSGSAGNDTGTEPCTDPEPASDPEQPTREKPELPCDGDCSCTLCRATVFSPIRVEAGGTLMDRLTSRQRLPIDQSSFRSRDQRFDLLRPPQL